MPLLNDSNDKHSSSLSINQRNQFLDNKLGENKSACTSSTVDSLVDLDNSSNMKRDEMKRFSNIKSSFDLYIYSRYD